MTTRPTTDKVREAVFNSLASMGVVEDAVVVDLFAGSRRDGHRGALAWRRALHVRRARPRRARARCAATSPRCGSTDRATRRDADVLAWVPAMRDVDLALVDPPYAFDDWPRLLGMLHAGVRAVRSRRARSTPPDGWETMRARRYGRTWATLLGRDVDA